MRLLNSTTFSGTSHSNGTEQILSQILITARYRTRNTALGALGILLNITVLPVVCMHDDLSRFLKATFCCMATGDLLTMATTMSAGLIPVHLSESEYNANIRKVTQTIYLSGNVNCLVMVTIAAERVLAVRRPELLKRLERSKVRVAAVQLCLWVLAILLTIPTLCCGNRDPQATTPLAIVTEFGVAMEAAITISSSLTVCVVYIYLANILSRHTCSSTDMTSSSDVAPSVPTLPGSSRSRQSTSCTPVTLHTGSLGVGVSAGINNPSLASTSSSGSRQFSSPRQLQRFRRATLHCAVLAIWFFLAYCPFGFYYLWVLASGTDRKEEAKTDRITIISSFPLANSLVGPLLLFWRLLKARALWQWIQRAVSGTGVRLELMFHVARNSLVTCCRRVARLRPRRRFRTSRVSQDPSASSREAPEVRKTVRGEGPSSRRQIHVHEAPPGKRVHFSRSSSRSSSSSSSQRSRSMSVISQLNKEVNARL